MIVVSNPFGTPTFAHEMRIVGRWIVGRQNLPLRLLEIAWADVRASVPVRFDGGPNLIAGELLYAGKLSRFFQRLDHEADLVGRGNVLEEGPAVADELRQGTARLRNGEDRQRDREPAVSRAEQDRPRIFRAVIIETINVGMPSATCGQVVSTGLTEGLGHIFRCTASIAFDPEILGLQ